jgi:hypothetical protein
MTAWRFPERRSRNTELAETPTASDGPNVEIAENVTSRECRVYQKHIFEGHQTMKANSPCSRLISERSL